MGPISNLWRGSFPGDINVKIKLERGSCAGGGGGEVIYVGMRITTRCIRYG